MRAIILAAGKGSRISKDIDAIPKSLLNINEKTIIETTVDILTRRNYKVSVCVGYRHDMIEEALQEKNVTFYYNPFYELANNIGSIWFAQKEFEYGEDILLLSADVVFDEGILDILEATKGDLVMATDTGRTLDGDYFFSLDEEGRIVDYGSQIEVSKRNCEYIGLSKVSGGISIMFKNRLCEMVDAGKLQDYFENVFFSFMEDEGILLRTVDINGIKWREIDYYGDYEKALSQFGK